MRQGENLHFERLEYVGRVERGYTALRAAGLDGLLMFHQESTIT